MWEAAPQRTGRPLVDEAQWLLDRGYAVFRIAPDGLVPVFGDFKSKHTCFSMLAIRKDAEGFRDDFADRWTQIDTCLNRTIGMDLNGRAVRRQWRSHSRAKRLRAGTAGEGGHHDRAGKQPRSAVTRQVEAARAAERKPGKGGGKARGGGEKPIASRGGGKAGGHKAGRSGSRRRSGGGQGQPHSPGGTGQGKSSSGGGGGRSAPAGQTRQTSFKRPSSGGGSSHGSSTHQPAAAGARSHQRKPQSRSHSQGGSHGHSHGTTTGGG